VQLRGGFLVQQRQHDRAHGDVERTQPRDDRAGAGPGGALAADALRIQAHRKRARRRRRGRRRRDLEEI
jgi:hypothetical protein